MAEDPNPSLRAEITAARDALEPQIRGLRALASIDLVSTDLRAAFDHEADHRQRRLDLEQAVLHALDAVITAMEALEAHGYPALPNAAILATLFAELRRQMDELQAAAGIFGSAQATALSIAFADPQAKPAA